MAPRDDIWIDDELQRQLAQRPRAAGETVSAVFTLRGSEASPLLSPEETESIARRVIERAASAARSQPAGVTVFDNLQSFALRGTAALVRQVLEQPEIETATANLQSESAFIEPVTRREVEIDESPPRAPRRQRRR